MRGEFTSKFSEELLEIDLPPGEAKSALEAYFHREWNLTTVQGQEGVHVSRYAGHLFPWGYVQRVPNRIVWRLSAAPESRTTLFYHMPPGPFSLVIVGYIIQFLLGFVFLGLIAIDRPVIGAIGTLTLFVVPGVLNCLFVASLLFISPFFSRRKPTFSYRHLGSTIAASREQLRLLLVLGVCIIFLWPVLAWQGIGLFQFKLVTILTLALALVILTVPLVLKNGINGPRFQIWLFPVIFFFLSILIFLPILYSVGFSLHGMSLSADLRLFVHPEYESPSVGPPFQRREGVFNAFDSYTGVGLLGLLAFLTVFVFCVKQGSSFLSMIPPKEWDSHLNREISWRYSQHYRQSHLSPNPLILSSREQLLAVLVTVVVVAENPSFLEGKDLR